jgi:pre-mRNA branch site protein p14
MALRKEVSRSLYIKNLPYKIESEDLYTIFGKYGSIRQIRLGNQHNTRGTAFVVYDDIFDAKNAQESLSGFNVGGRYLVCLYFSEDRGKR